MDVLSAEIIIHKLFSRFCVLGLSLSAFSLVHNSYPEQSIRIMHIQCSISKHFTLIQCPHFDTEEPEHTLFHFS